MANYRYTLLTLMLGLSLLFEAHSGPSQTSALKRRHTCQTVRAPNYYGLGVRLGIYCTWFQSLLANTMMPGEVSAALDRNAIFLFTLLVAMVKCTAIKMILQIDGLILAHLSSGYVFGILSIWGHRTCHYAEEGPRAIKRYGGFGTHLKLFVTLAICTWGLWFWVAGVSGTLDAMGPANGNPWECNILHTSFMMMKVRADGGVRILSIAAYSCCVAYFGIMFLVSTAAGYARISKILKLSRSKQWAQTSRLRYATGFNGRELKSIFNILRWFNLVWILSTILLVEISLHYNNVTAVLGGPEDNELHFPSQLLALMIGAFGLVRLCYLKIKDWRSPGDRNPSISENVPETESAHQETPRLGLNILKVFSSNYSAEGKSPNNNNGLDKDESNSEQEENHELDELVRGKSTRSRYLISWLPWLVLIQEREARMGDCEAGSGDTPLLEREDEGTKMDRSDSCTLSVASSSTLREEHPMV